MIRPAVLRAPRGRFLLRLAGSALLLGLLLLLFPAEEMGRAFRRIGILPLCLLALGVLLVHVVGAWKWNYVLGVVEAALPGTHALRFYLYGMFANLFLPSLIGGDLVSVGLALRDSPRRGALVAGSLLHRAMDFAALAVLLLAGLAAAPLGKHAPPVRLAGWAPLAAGLGLAGMLGILVPRWRRCLPLLDRIRARGMELVRLAAARPPQVAIALAVSILMQAILLALTIATAQACGLRVPPALWLLAWPLAKMAAFLPVSQGGIGVRELALAGILAPFGFPAATVVAVGLVWEAGIVLACLTGGVCAWLLSLPVRSRRRGQEPPGQGDACADAP